MTSPPYNQLADSEQSSINDDPYVHHANHGHKSKWKFTGLRVPLEPILLAAFAVLLFIWYIFTSSECRPSSNNFDILSSSSRFASDPSVEVLFVEDLDFVNAESLLDQALLRDKLRHWKNMVPARSSGNIWLSPEVRQNLNLPPPNWTPIPEREQESTNTTAEDQEYYVITVFHQLHCLSFIYAWVGGIDIFPGDSQETLNHVAHCIDYIRQGVLCAGDTTIEGRTRYGEGWGSVHQCRDMDRVRTWADEHAALTWHEFGDIL